MTYQSRAIRSQSQKSEMCETQAFDFFNCDSSTMSQFCAIAFQRPKCADLAQARTNAYETIGKRPVNLDLIFDLETQNLHRIPVNNVDLGNSNATVAENGEALLTRVIIFNQVQKKDIKIVSNNSWFYWDQILDVIPKS